MPNQLKEIRIKSHTEVSVEVWASFTEMEQQTS